MSKETKPPLARCDRCAALLPAINIKAAWWLAHRAGEVAHLCATCIGRVTRSGFSP